MSQVIVLGWDALDTALIEEFGLDGRFGLSMSRIETITSPQVGGPHTRELWPTIITGRHPTDHGIRAVDPAGGVEWDNRVIDLASTLANGVVPESVRSWIGRRLRERGAGLDQKDPSYYESRGLSPVVAGPDRRAISIPNYVTPYDQQHGLEATRDTVWGELLADPDGQAGYEPRVAVSTMNAVLGREVGRRVGHTLTAIEANYSLVVCWFGLLDTVGHIAPTVDCPLQRDWYEYAAQVTAHIRQCAPADATVVSLSDHGLRDGNHTEYATIASDDHAPVAAIDDVRDVAGWLRERVSVTAPDGVAVDAETAAATRDHLESMGYL